VQVAYDAARVAASLIQARTFETVEASPFFKTRVMAAIRERQLTPEEPALVRMWRAAGVLISTLALLLVTLTGMTIFSQSPDSQSRNAGRGRKSESLTGVRGVGKRGDLDDDELSGTIRLSEPCTTWRTAMDSRAGSKCRLGWRS